MEDSSRRGQVEALRRKVCAYQIQKDLGQASFGTTEEAEQHAAELMRLYSGSLALAEGCDPKDPGVADELVALAVTVLMAARHLDPSPATTLKLMLQSILVLEAAQVRRQVEGAMRLAACALYGLMGAPTLAAQHYDALSIKHIMHDSMSGHQLLPVLLGGGASEPAAQLVRSIQALQRDHLRDAGETLAMAHQHGTYTKVVEFVDFKERLQQSHTVAVADAEAAAAASVRSVASAVTSSTPNPVQQVPSTSCPSDSRQLRFNEDLSTCPAWLPPHSGEARLAVACWWEQHSTAPVPGFAQCWWSRTEAAESSEPEAVTMRQRLQAALQRRQLVAHLPNLLQHPVDNAAASSVQDMLQAHILIPLRALDSAPASPPCTSGAAEKGHSRVSPVAVPLSQQLEALQLNMLACAAAGQAFLADGQSSAKAEPFQKHIGQLQELFQRLCEGLDQALQAGCNAGGMGLVMGPGIAVAAGLLGDAGPCLAACIKAWRQHLRPSTPKKKKKEGFANGVNAVAPVVVPDIGVQLFDAVAALQNVFLQSLGLISGKLHNLSNSLNQVAPASQLFGWSKDERQSDEQQSEALAADLWGWEPKVDASQVLQALRADQQKTVLALRKGAEMML